MDQQRQPAAAQTIERQPQVRFIYPRKTVNSGVNEEAFESRHSRVDQRQQRVGVAAHHAAPGGPVDPRLSLGGITLGLQCM